MSKFEIATTLISGFSILIAVGSLIWNIINAAKNRNLQKHITYLTGEIEKSNYVSKVVFDSIFEQFQKISKCLFENYNNAAARLFPLLEQTICMIPDKEGKFKKMLEFYSKSQNDLNELISLTQVNRFILTDEIIEKLENFEDIIKQLIIGYENKMCDVRHSVSYEYLTRDDERVLISKADESMQMFKDIVGALKKHIESLKTVK